MSKGIEMSAWKKNVFEMFLGHRLEFLGVEVSEKDLEYLANKLGNSPGFNADLDEVIDGWTYYLIADLRKK